MGERTMRRSRIRRKLGGLGLGMILAIAAGSAWSAESGATGSRPGAGTSSDRKELDPDRRVELTDAEQPPSTGPGPARRGPLANLGEFRWFQWAKLLLHRPEDGQGQRVRARAGPAPS